MPADAVEESLGKVKDPSEHLEAELAFEKRLYRWPSLTVALLVVCVLIWFLMEWVYTSEDPLLLLAFGAKNRSLILEGEVFRLISASFLHIGYKHLLFNAIALVQLGLFCENIYGRPRFLFLYIFSGVGGFLLASALSDAVSAGASASLFGLMGSMLVFGWKHRKGIPPFFQRLFTWMLLPWVILNLLVGRFVANVDNYAHVGGLITGIVLAWLIDNHILKDLKASHGKRGTALGAFSLLVILISAGTVIRGLPTYLSHIESLESAADNGDGLAFASSLDELILSHPNEGLFYAQRAEGHIRGRAINPAIEDLRHALSLNHSPSSTRNRLAWLLLTRGDGSPQTQQMALNLARQSVRKSPDAGNLNTLGYALLQKDQLANAKKRLEQALAQDQSIGWFSRIGSLFEGAFDKPEVETGSPFDLLMLAMVHKRLGENEAAEKCLDRGILATKLYRETLIKQSAPRPPLSINTRLVNTPSTAIDRILAQDELDILNTLEATAIDEIRS